MWTWTWTCGSVSDYKWEAYSLSLPGTGDFKIPSGAEHILRTLTAAGYEAYLVGGCVRDLLRGVKPHDWDICTSARPEETERCFAGERIIETGLKYGTITLLKDGKPYEVTTYRAEGPYSDSRRPDYIRFVPNLEDDLVRRDFTVNAIALGLDGGLRDPFGGEADIRAGRLRCVGKPSQRFREDGLRIMRALRFAASFGWELEEKTARAIHDNRAVLEKVAAERINVELRKLLVGESAGDILREYPDVLCQFWPELSPLVNAPRGGWERTIRAVDAVPAELEPRLAAIFRAADPEEADRALLALRFAKKVSAALVEEAVSSLAQAKAMHDDLEAIYNPHVDFELVDEFAADIWEEILTF